MGEELVMKYASLFRMPNISLDFLMYMDPGLILQVSIVQLWEIFYHKQKIKNL